MLRNGRRSQRPRSWWLPLGMAVRIYVCMYSRMRAAPCVHIDEDRAIVGIRLCANANCGGVSIFVTCCTQCCALCWHVVFPFQVQFCANVVSSKRSGRGAAWGAAAARTTSIARGLNTSTSRLNHAIWLLVARCSGLQTLRCTSILIRDVNTPKFFGPARPVVHFSGPARNTIFLF